MSDSPVSLTPSGPPETVLPEPDPDAAAALAGAIAADDPKAAVAAVVADHPRYLDAWARLGMLTDDPVESYAYFRIGYHRGLDTLRGSGWRGSGFVRWRHPSNRGFLRALAGLGGASARIGEQDEVDRIDGFLLQLDPDWPPSGGWREAE
jgi:hypothetical protein